MKKVLGLAIIALGVFLEVMWLGVCFGTVIIGILLLFFAPGILFFPFNFFLVIGLSLMNPGKYSRTNSFQYRQYSGQSNYNNSYNNSNTYTQTQDVSDKYYEVLESKKTDTLDTIKANYRRLMKEYHYDSIASKDLPQEMVEFAEEKTKLINEAYSAIKQMKGK